MPSIYAHNKFGKKVLSRLDDSCKEAVKKYPNQFRIGLQGPDYLFFYLPYISNPANKLGHSMHDRPALEFFESAVNTIRKNKSDLGLLSYIFGFICHFALDSECHPYIEQAIRESGVGHIEIESEYDRHLMEKDGVNPLKYPVWKLVPTDTETVGDVAEFYDGVSAKNIKSALVQMKLTKRVLMPGAAKEKISGMLFRMTTHYVDLQGHIIKQKVNKKCEISNQRLDELFYGAVDVAVALIENLITHIDGKGELSARFNRNFK